MKIETIWMIWKTNYCNLQIKKWSLSTNSTFTQKGSTKSIKNSKANLINCYNFMIKTMTKYLSSKNGPFWMSLNMKSCLVWHKSRDRKDKSNNLRRSSLNSKRRWLLTQSTTHRCKKLAMRIK